MDEVPSEVSTRDRTTVRGGGPPIPSLLSGRCSNTVGPAARAVRGPASGLGTGAQQVGDPDGGILMQGEGPCRGARQQRRWPPPARPEPSLPEPHPAAGNLPEPVEPS